MTMIPAINLCDMYEDKLVYGSLRVLAPVFRSFGKRATFADPASTLKAFGDNGLVRAALEEQGAGRVLMTDGGGSLCCAPMGGNLGKLAEENGWEGTPLNGCVCDTRELAECNVGIYVLAIYPRKSIEENTGWHEVGVRMPGAYIQPGEWIYADEDGVLVSQDILE